jgi:hypothetical protein
MKVWYDACTGKHIRYGTAIAKRLRKAGHEVIFTTREHPDTLALAHALGENPIIVGKYDPSSLSARLEESVNRILQFSRLLKDNLPDMAISHQSVELCRTAFGLNIPIILTADTPHATATNKLTIPLASTLIVSESIPKRFFRNCGAQNIVQFKGVDEVAWIKDFKPSKNLEFKKPLIVVRQMETKASYAYGKDDITLKLAKKLTSLGNVLFLSRYAKVKKEGIILMEDFVDSANIVAHADLVIGAGGTICREAALQGIPTIAISKMSRTYVNKYLAEKGFPLFLLDQSKVLSYAKKYLKMTFDVRAKLGELENPLDVIETSLQKSDLYSA